MRHSLTDIKFLSESDKNILFFKRMLLRSPQYGAWLLVILSSSLLGLAWCSFWLGSLLFIAIVPLLFIVKLQTQHKTSMHGLGYIFFTLLLWHVATLWWVSYASLVAFLLGVFYNAFCLFLPWVGYYYMRKRGQLYVAYVSLIAGWLTVEHAHLNWEHWEMSFPWLNLGNGLAALAPWIQWYAYTGVLGGSLWILIANIFLYHLLGESRVSSFITGGYGAWLCLPIVMSLIHYYGYSEKGIPVEAVVAQPNFDPYTEKYAGSISFIPYNHQIAQLLSLSEQLLTPKTKIIIWPESAISCSLDEKHIHNDPLVQPISQLTAQYPSIHLITGTGSFCVYGSERTTATALERNGKYVDEFNSMLDFKYGHRVVVYRKVKRLPGAECIPYFYIFPKSILHWIKQKFADIGEIDPSLGKGNGTKVFYIDPSIKVAPLICYESLYGSFAGEACRGGATLFAVVTNDGWWGDTPIYHQHFQYSRLLAIAHRRSVMRAANTGISGFINQRGEVVAQTDRLVAVAMRQEVYANHQMTFYSLHGDYIGRMAAWTCLVLLIFFACTCSLFCSLVFRRNDATGLNL